ncbi:MAG: UbiD family decarboxylase [Leptospiraceae bacterium]|nr:UbiD family decarboxylase [Leptospiraceae bacterium]
MNYRNLADCVHDLQKSGRLLRITDPVDPHLELAAIHRRVYAHEGPALLFENVKGSRFPVLTNLFGTLERGRYIFRHTLRQVQALIQAKAEGPVVLRKVPNWWRIGLALAHAVPRRTMLTRGVRRYACRVSDLPQIVSWPDDGGPFLTLPQVYSEDPVQPGVLHSNLGMYRIQLGGNAYQQDREVGLHYQTHRGIGIHHSQALQRGEALRVTIFAGGPPAHSLAAVMPLPEGLPEVAFAGALAGRNFRYQRLKSGHLLASDSDFCITGHIASYLKPEGPFGDHLGYYALQHDFPVLLVDQVYHRPHAIWPATVVGRPPAEDTTFGALIHELTAPMVPVSIPGVLEMHAVDAAGVHPLMFAIGSERYTPWLKDAPPQEILTQASAILGFGHASLAKYLFITTRDHNPHLSTHDASLYLQHVLERFVPQRDLHFITNTTIDTLDYSAGQGLNRGSKVIWAAHGPALRQLGRKVPATLKLPAGFRNAGLALPGVIVIQGPRYSTPKAAARQIQKVAAFLKDQGRSAKWSGQFPLVVIVDDAAFSCQSLRNWLWITFTRSDPASDIYGVDSFVHQKHWGCKGPVLIDARFKTHQAPGLQSDAQIEKKVDALAGPGKVLNGII